MELNKQELINGIHDDGFITNIAERYLRYYDKNHNSVIDKKELLKVMKDISRTFYGCEPEAAAIEEQFKKIDKDKNNTIDFGEFKNFIKDYIKMLIEF